MTSADIPVPESVLQPVPTVSSVVDGFDFSSLKKVLDDVDADVGTETTESDVKGFISTGCSVLDAQIGQGYFLAGYPIGRFTEIMGTEGVGKTTLATHAMISAQKGQGVQLEWRMSEEGGRSLLRPFIIDTKLQKGLAILIDSESKWPMDRAQSMGLNPHQLIRIHADEIMVNAPEEAEGKKKKKKSDEEEDVVSLSLEKCIVELEKVVERVVQLPYFRRPDVPVIVVWDSLAASPIDAELEGAGLSDGIAAKARKVRMLMRKMTQQIAIFGITVLIVNQVYDRINVPGTDSSGGRGLKFHSSLRMKLSKGMESDWRSGTERIGITTQVECIKSSICPPSNKLPIPIRFATGIDDDVSLLDFFTSPGVKSSLISKAGSWLKLHLPDLAEPISFQYGSWSQLLVDRPTLRSLLLAEMMKIIRGN